MARKHDKTETQSYYAPTRVRVKDEGVLGSEAADDKVTDKSPGAGKWLKSAYGNNANNNSYGGNYGQGDYSGGYGNAGNWQNQGTGNWQPPVEQNTGTGQPPQKTSGSVRFRNESLLKRQKPGQVGRGGGSGGGSGCGCADNEEQSKTGKQIKGEAQAAASNAPSGNTSAAGGSGSTSSGGSAPTQSNCECAHDESVIPPQNEVLKNVVNAQKSSTNNSSLPDYCKTEGKKLHLYIFIDETLSQKEKNTINMNTVKRYIDEMYDNNNIPHEVHLIDLATGKQMYEQFITEKLPPNQLVLKITNDPTETMASVAGYFKEESGNTKFIVNHDYFPNNKNKTDLFSGKKIFDLNYQIANTAVHESIHAMIYKLIKFYGQFTNDYKALFYQAFNLSTTLFAKAGEVPHGHNKYFKIPNLNDQSSVPFLRDKSIEHILEEQQYAINTFLEDVCKAKGIPQNAYLDFNLMMNLMNNAQNILNFGWFRQKQRLN